MKHKIKEWVQRYLPAEILSLIATLVTCLVVFKTTGSHVTTALAGTWAGNIAYFGYILVADVRKTYLTCQLNANSYRFSTFIRNFRALLVEFGLAEVVDSFLIRPALMYYLPLLVGNLAAGVLLAKFAADVTFYVPAIIGYEFSKKNLRNS
jgi:hypothetical protein